MRLCSASLLLACCSHWPHAPSRAHSTACQPASPSSALEVVRSLLQERGRVSLAQVGEHLRSTDTALPDDSASLSAFVHAHPETFSLTGKPSHRVIALTEDTTSAALVRTVAAVLQECGATSTSELKLRLSERGQSIPGLSTLLRRNQDTFTVHEGTVALREGAGPAVQLAAAASPPLQRLLALGIPSSMSPAELPDPSSVREVILIDMDNNAFALERSVARAAAASGDVLVLCFSSTAHNPRLTADTAAHMTALAAAGRLRLLTPVRDAKNANPNPSPHRVNLALNPDPTLTLTLTTDLDHLPLTTTLTLTPGLALDPALSPTPTLRPGARRPERRGLRALLLGGLASRTAAAELLHRAGVGGHPPGAHRGRRSARRGARDDRQPRLALGDPPVSTRACRVTRRPSASGSGAVKTGVITCSKCVPT